MQGLKNLLLPKFRLLNSCVVQTLRSRKLSFKIHKRHVQPETHWTIKVSSVFSPAFTGRQIVAACHPSIWCRQRVSFPRPTTATVTASKKKKIYLFALRQQRAVVSTYHAKLFNLTFFRGHNGFFAELENHRRQA